MNLVMAVPFKAKFKEHQWKHMQHQAAWAPICSYCRADLDRRVASMA